MSGRMPWDDNPDLFEIADPASCLGSCFGNYDVDIYDEDIEALKSGKMLVYIDEYGFRIHYKEGKKPNPMEVSYGSSNS